MHKTIYCFVLIIYVKSQVDIIIIRYYLQLT